MKAKPKTTDEYTAFSSLLRAVVTPQAKARVDADKAARKHKAKPSVSGRAKRTT